VLTAHPTRRCYPRCRRRPHRRRRTGSGLLERRLAAAHDRNRSQEGSHPHRARHRFTVCDAIARINLNVSLKLVPAERRAVTFSRLGTLDERE
jgi:hypothetical protein